MVNNITLPASFGTVIASKEIENSGELAHVQLTIIVPKPFVARSHGTVSDITASPANNIYALVGIRAQAASTDLEISLQLASVLAQTADNFEWYLYQNPIVAGTFTYSALANSGMEVATGATANTVTGGIPLIRGYGIGSGQIQAQLENEFEIGGTSDEFILAVKPYTANAQMQGSLVWRELT